jgi:regulator of PEP synthase PpsR (kinase-PPPase family)
MASKRSAYFVSDRTGITAEMMGHSLLTQFVDTVSFNEVTLPFIDSVEKARAAVAQIDSQGALDGVRPLVFSTLVHSDVSAVVASANALFLDCFEVFILPMERELGVHASHTVGRSHSANDFANYHHRIEAVNYSLSHDDGVSTRDLSDADVTHVSLSRDAIRHPCRQLSADSRRLQQYATPGPT